VATLYRWGERGAVAVAQVGLAAVVVLVGAGLGVGIQRAAGIGDDESIEVALEAVPVFECPAGAETGEVHRGDRILATGRDDNGGWVEIRDPRNLSERVWVAARHLVPDADLGDLAVRACAPEEQAGTQTEATAPPPLPPDVTTATPPGGRAPGPAGNVPGSPGNVPGPSGNAPGGGADTAGPAISNVSATPSEIWEQHASLCGSAPRQSSINASASDPSGVSSLAASWAFASVNETKNIPAHFGLFPYHTIPSNTQQPVTITITARDGRGNSSTTTTTVLLHSADQCFG
jgi:hypothetical protein